MISSMVTRMVTDVLHVVGLGGRMSDVAPAQSDDMQKPSIRVTNA